MNCLINYLRFCKECHQLFTVCYLHLTWDLFSAHAKACLLLVRAEMFTNDYPSDICLHISPTNCPTYFSDSTSRWCRLLWYHLLFFHLEIFGLCPSSKQSDSKLCGASSEPPRFCSAQLQMQQMEKDEPALDD